jgi:DNA-binding MarR family transcriptional regulator
MAARRRPSGQDIPGQTDILDQPDLLDQPVPCLEAAGACAEGTEDCVASAPADLSQLEPADRLRVLAGVTARFSAGYLRWMRSQVGEVLAFSGIRVLGVLESGGLQSGGPAIMRDLAANLGLTARNVTAVIDSLEEAGLVSRVPHPHDRRATVIELTAAGRREAVRSRRQAEALAAQAFDSLSVEEQQTYADLLVRLSSRFCP